MNNGLLKYFRKVLLMSKLEKIEVHCKDCQFLTPLSLMLIIPLFLLCSRNVVVRNIIYF